MLDHLGADRARIADLQARILDLESCLSELRHERSQAQERLDSYKYPVLSLPSELVSEIFVHALPPCPNFPKLTGPESPFHLTHICRSWRQIAVGTPALWSAIAFDKNPREWQLHIFELWLQRSRHHPLSLRLGTATWANDKLVEVMALHRARWEYLKIDFEVNNLRILDTPMPSAAPGFESDR